MAWGNVVEVYSGLWPMEAGEDLSSDIFHFVVASTTAGQVLRPNAATDIPIGVLIANEGSGLEATVVSINSGFIVKCKAGGSGVSAGDAIKPEYIGAADAGKGITASSTDIAYGYALTAAAEDEHFALALVGTFTVP